MATGSEERVDGFQDILRDSEQIRSNAYVVVDKWIALSALIVVIISTPSMIISSLAAVRSRAIDYEVKYSNNGTAYVFVKRYDLREGVFLTVCNLGGEVILDIRRS